MERAGEDRASRFDLLAAESARARRDREKVRVWSGCPARPAESLSREVPADPVARATASPPPRQLES